jgi:ABC-type sugar transport system ATPase subunit
MSLDREEMRKETQKLLDTLEFDIDASTEVGKLSTAKQQLALFARTVALNSNLIVMDEPTSSLSLQKQRRFIRLLNGLRLTG